MDSRVLNILEYPKVIDKAAKHAATMMGQRLMHGLKPSNQLDKVNHLQKETDEGTHILRKYGDLPFGGITDIKASLKRSEIGGMLNPKELIEIADTIRGTRLVKQFLIEAEEDETLHLPILMGMVEPIEPKGEIERMIRRCIDDNAQVMDSASEALRNVRQQLRTLNARIKEKLENIIRSSNYQKMLSESIITIRNERHVVPVKQEYRGTFGGIVHDQSASGATLFIEPQVIVDLNNQLSESRAKERYEIERILRMLSESVAFLVAELLDHIERMAQLDLIFARVKYGKSIRGTKPALNDSSRIKFIKARHPLIAGETVVPIDVHMEGHTQAMVITGPNTGGKTVTLKTVGLLSLMAQSGFQIPVEEGSDAALFTKVFADIGDEQSIEQSLSTFSSHMTNIVNILKQLDSQSLVLFDELGAGTDPQEGAALSMAILDYAIQEGAKLIATTHYSELKAFAYEREGVINASVEFDVATLSPTYRLLIGIPGRSNAFEISKKLGLGAKIIEDARKHISHEENQVDAMIASLEKNQKEAERANREAEVLKKEIEVQAEKLEQEKEIYLKQKEVLFAKAKQEADAFLKNAREEADAVIAELREYQKQGAAVKEHKVIDAKSRLDHALDRMSPNDSSIKAKGGKENKNKTLKPGQEVKVISFGQKGHIVEKLSDKEYLVQVGIMKMNLPGSDLKLVKAEKDIKPVVNVRTQQADLKTELDLRGQRFDEAINRLEKYIDAALLANYHQVSIIHGKGTGALRSGVTNYIKGHPRIKQSRMGAPGEGGSGVTVIELK